MQVVHKTNLPDSKTEVILTQNIDTGDVVVDIGLTKHGFADGHLGQPVRLEYKASEAIEPTVVMKGKKGKVTSSGKKTQDEYIEGTVRPDMDGKMKDFEEGLDEDVHEFFKEIADEGSFLTQKRNRDKVIKTKKASGGVAHMLGE